jgi:D-glycero-D-manno-heptose 1,7-bisphosphate phosphatase
VKHRALFLDRDGVINVDHGYVHRPDQFTFIDGIFDLCRRARDLDYLIVVVTNQAGIGRGFYTEQAFHDLTAWMKQRFADQGIDIAAVYFCPHHAEHGVGKHRRECARRKPNPGMLLDAAREHAIDLSRSLLIGDKESDIEAGRRAMLGGTVLVGKCTVSRADAVVDHLRQSESLLVRHALTQDAAR